MSTWQLAAFTHRGRVRADNEDTVAIDRQILTGNMTAPIAVAPMDAVSVLMIADGMGGHAHGSTASRAVLDRLIADIERLASQATCTNAIEDANDHLYELMQSDPDAIGMGTTLVGAVLTSTQLLIFNVGDSRAYLHSHDHLILLSQDDVPITGVSRSGDRVSHAVTQAIGGSTFQIPLEPHVSAEPPLMPGESLLLCSDGLTDMVADRIICDVLCNAADIETTVRKLAAHAFRAGGSDNLSIVLARRASSNPPPSHN
jgi:PPM family protein phosphatase